MELDAVFLSRLQFAWVVAWHILLPAFTVGLASYIAVLEGIHFVTGRDVFVRISQFWLKIFAVSFGLGVVTGIVMPFQFGTNWSRFTDATADVISPLLAYEGLTAFFLEAAFLGVLLFGRKRVPPAVHFFAALMVAVGTLLSSFWILAVNSWMQTPVGHELVDGRFYPADWMQIIFSPSFPYRLAHTVVAFYVTTGFVVLGVGAYTIRRGPFGGGPRDVLDGGVAADGPGAAADLHRRPARAQHAQAPAGQGRGDGRPCGTPVPACRSPCSRFPTRRPSATASRSRSRRPAASILTHELDGVVKGLKDWPRDERPPVAIVFFAFRIMVGIGMLMLAHRCARLGPALAGASLSTGAGTCACASGRCRSASSRCSPAGP